MIGVGDVVECVDDESAVCSNNWMHSAASIKRNNCKNKTFRVVRVVTNACGCLKAYLRPGNVPCALERLRKVLPADPKFIEQIRKLKPVREGADA